MPAFSPFCAQRPWGHEFVVVMEPPFYSVKILEINKGSEGGLQYHHFKTECGLILKGSLEIKSGSDPSKLQRYVLEAGSFFSISS